MSEQYSLASLAALIDGITLTYNRLTLHADRLHGDRGLTTGLRALLICLDEFGPQTIPELAGRRSVSRQFVQRLVQVLSAGGWVEARDNPRHRRSSLLALTEKGVLEIQRIRRIEAPFLVELATGLDAQDLQSAAATVQKLANRLAH